MGSNDSKALHVLVAEDDEDVRRLLVMALGRHFTVSGVASGREAARTLVERKPDLMLADLELPGLCGEALALRAALLPEPPVVFLMSGDHERLRGARRLASRTIEKPFSVLALVHDLEQHHVAADVV